MGKKYLLRDEEARIANMYINKKGGVGMMSGTLIDVISKIQNF